MNKPLFAVIVGFVLTLNASHAQRIPVLNQIDLPHNYYFRELFLPQLTSGPSAAAWKDSQTLVFSMAGSLWLQSVSATEASQLTDGDGYDYQPDVSPDGEQVAFVRYNGKTAELMLYNLETRQTTPLTQNGGVNLEPRWSPDGQRLAFVSTLKTGHFLVHTAKVENGQLTEITCVTPDRKSEVKRYYYSVFDHAINPAWSATGNEIFFVSNREIVHGTGDISSVNLQTGVVKTIWHEETSWQARPDISPDGSRMVYSSFAGRNWNQLWLMRVAGGYPFPLTYGEYDNRSPRWSPDGERIAFISNRDGNTGLWVITAFDGKQTEIKSSGRKYLHPAQSLVALVRDEKGNEVTSRISITDSRGKFYAPSDVWIHADDSRFKNPGYEEHYFHKSQVFEVKVPQDKLIIRVTHGPQYEVAVMEVDATKPLPGPVTIQLKKLTVPSPLWSGDLHVHMNYGGHYLNTPTRLAKQAEGEDLNFVYNLIVNKEQRIPDINYFSAAPDPASTSKAMILHGQEFHTSYWGHLGLLHIKDHVLLPDYAGYYNTAVASIFPHNSYIADKAHAQGGIVGYVHPFDSSVVVPEPYSGITHALPVDAALGKADYLEVVGFSDHKATEFAWYQLLNCGLKVPAGAGTDAMANYASLRGPVGLNRVYVNGDGALDQTRFEKLLKEGRSFVSNGPLVGLTVNNANPGDSILVNPKNQTLSYSAWLRSNASVDHFEIVWNSKVVAKHALTGDRKSADMKGTLKLKGAGWLVVRAWSDRPQAEVFDIYPYATSNPVWVLDKGKRFQSKASADYMLKWIARLETAAMNHPSYRQEKEKELVLKDIRRAKEYYLGIGK